MSIIVRASMLKARRIMPPMKNSKSDSRTIRHRKPPTRKKPIAPYLSRFTVLWVQGNGVAYDTRGFVAKAYSCGKLLGRAPFDSYGTARFSKIRTPTKSLINLQLLDDCGRVYRVSAVPPDLTAFVVIG